MGLLLLAAGLFAVLAAGAAAINTDALTNLDTSVAEWFDAHRTRRRDVEAMGVFAYLGRPVHVLSVAVVVGSLLSVRARSAKPVMLVAGGVGLGVAVEQTFKALIGRTATTQPLVEYPHSYPSGHVTGCAALLGMIALCLGTGRGRAVKTVLALLVGVSVLFVAGLALYTGAHTFTDVIGGMALGGSILALGAAILGDSAPRVA
ncbi:MAG: phosphatase PAP2 family protein [Mycobacterium sp.]